MLGGQALANRRSSAREQQRLKSRGSAYLAVSRGWFGPWAVTGCYPLNWAVAAG
jgi:hypothetical protein